MRKIAAGIVAWFLLSQLVTAQDEAPPQPLVAASSRASPQAALMARSNEEKQVTIRVRNYARIASAVLFKAETTANKILQEAGVQTVWVVCFDGSTWSRDTACTSLPDPMDLTVNVHPFPRSERFRQRYDVFGYALEDGEQGFGRDAWIFYDPIKSFAVEKEISLALLLGHVFAHEFGHLLLGANSHSGMGLMCARWSTRELLAANQGGLFFSDSESRRIQKAVLARSKAGGAESRTFNDGGG
jgi:hypothetical protein